MENDLLLYIVLQKCVKNSETLFCAKRGPVPFGPPSFDTPGATSSIEISKMLN